MAIALIPFLSSERLPLWSSLCIWIIGLSALTMIAVGVGLGWMTVGQGPREDANLLATRGSEPPRRWIVAHLDSKAQAQSMAGRLVAVWFVAGAIVALTVLVLLRLQGPVSLPWVLAGVCLALAAGMLAGRGQLQGHSVGARDNGSGVIAALRVAAGASADSRVGILITGAEEFGLVGARVFASLEQNLGAVQVVNLDTLDQEGRLYLVSHDGRGGRLARALEARLATLGLTIQRRRLPWGILVDSLPLARRGARAVTVGRLTWGTLQRIHTPRDTAEEFSLSTAERVGQAIAEFDLSLAAE